MANMLNTLAYLLCFAQTLNAGCGMTLDLKSTLYRRRPPRFPRQTLDLRPNDDEAL